MRPNALAKFGRTGTGIGNARDRSEGRTFGGDTEVVGSWGVGKDSGVHGMGVHHGTGVGMGGVDGEVHGGFGGDLCGGAGEGVAHVVEEQEIFGGEAILAASCGGDEHLPI